jgi:prepilin-type N-terminal cleavage/methylation domain-containing protein
MDRDAGFSLLEITIAIAVLLVVTSTVFAIINPAAGAFAVAPEAADMQQRLRSGTDTLFRSLMMAGAGPYLDGPAGALHMFFAPVLPFRRGAIRDAAPGSYTTDTITVYYVPVTAVQTTTSVPVVAADAALRVNLDAGCPRTPDGTLKPLCGCEPGMSLLIFDQVGRYDVFTVNSVNDDMARLAVNKPAASATTIYPVGSKVVEVVERTFALHIDVARKLYRLVSYDGSDRADVPVVDNVVAVKFEYFGEPRPPEVRQPVDDRIGPWTSYGPRPPPAGVKWTAYPEGESCTFGVDASGKPFPRLAVLDDGASGYPLVKLTEAQLTDGPWCPDMISPDRFDADLLRIRAIGVTLRVQTALDALRGPAGTLFFNAGAATNAGRWVPDQELHFDVTPRNLNLGR